MKGKNQFNRVEATRIRQLLAEKQRADSNRKKAIRAALRGIGFFITDFDQSYQGFMLEHFEALISTGAVGVA